MKSLSTKYENIRKYEKKSKKKILLTDLATLNHTFGAQALTFPLVEKLSKFDCTIVLAPSYFKDNIEFAKRNHLRIIAEPNPIAALGAHSDFFQVLKEIRILILKIIGRGQQLKNEQKTLKIFLKEFKESDLILDANGIEFIGNLPFKKKWLQAWRTLYTQILAQKMGKKYLKTTKSYGPFQGLVYRALVKYSLRNLPFLLVRAGESNLEAVKKLQLKTPIYEFPDISLVLQPTPKGWAEKYLENLGLDLKKPILGISPSAVIGRLETQYCGGENHLKLILGIIKNYQRNSQILIIPHAREDGINPRKCDAALARQILSKAENHRNVYLLDDQPLTYPQVRAIIGLLDFYIGGRFHGIASALVMGVPTVSLSWHVKYQDLMSLYLDEFPLIDSRKATVVQALNTIKRYYQDRKWFNTIKVAVRQKEIEKKIDENIEMIIKELKG